MKNKTTFVLALLVMGIMISISPVFAAQSCVWVCSNPGAQGTCIMKRVCVGSNILNYEKAKPYNPKCASCAREIQTIFTNTQSRFGLLFYGPLAYKIDQCNKMCR